MINELYIWHKGLLESLTTFFYLWAKGIQRLDHKVNKTIPTKILSVYNYLFALIYNLNLFQHCK